LLFFSTTFAQKDWEYVKTKNGVSMYNREFLNHGIKQFKLKTVFKGTTLAAIFATFRDHESYPEWQKDIKEIKTLKKVTEIENIDYYNIEIPWPFKNRDAIYHQKISYNHTDKSLNLSFTCEPSFIPEVENRVRMKDAAGSWKFLKKPNGDIEVEYQNYSDPVGIPAEVVNMIFSDALFRTMENLRKQVQKEKYRNKKYTFIAE
jgi:hypothetical protein